MKKETGRDGRQCRDSSREAVVKSKNSQDKGHESENR